MSEDEEEEEEEEDDVVIIIISVQRQWRGRGRRGSRLFDAFARRAEGRGLLGRQSSERVGHQMRL